MKTMKRIVWLAAIVLLGGAARAQQDPMYTMYMWNMSAVNPGYAGSSDMLTATAIARQQWVGVPGAPSTQAICLHSPLRKQSIGLGLSAWHDQVGPVNSTLLFADFAYRIRTGENARLAFGLKAGVVMNQTNLTEVVNTGPSDPSFQSNVSSKATPNFGFGLYYWGKKAYIGLSTPKLLEYDLVSADGSSTFTSLLKQQRHYSFIAGCVVQLGRDLKFRPSVLLKAVQGAPLEGDLTAMFLLKERLWLGAAYRTGDSVDGIIALQITDQFKVGYAYDFTLTELRNHHSGSHEIMLSYDLRFRDKKVLSPRYF